MDWTKHKEGNIPTKHPGELRILSIDGGGMKGILPAVYLKRIEEQLGKPIYQFFDMICGTSTGGIIALGLAKGIRAGNISDIYIKKGEKIFPKNLLTNPLLSAKYSNKQLLELLKDVLGEKRLEDALTMLCIPSIEHHKAEPKVFKTPHHKDYILDGCRFMWEVALATSAAPLFFPAAEIGEAECKIDGGLWANNPILVAIAEAKKLGFGLEQVKILSLGTGDSIYQVSNAVAKKSGLKSWGTNLVDLTFQVQSKSATYTASYLLGENLCRISPTFGRKISLDSTEKEDIDFMVIEANQLYEKTFIKEGVRDKFFC
ncbi:CBASS cGAMP-activated phospholipase [Metabacillus malikii]|uniref:Patatin-like phospholipase/acyl hydrolase n=1 Tax=Metabacillus malikii TaxID=1504265 RepID=A0ABT9ZFB8_9BACI|nr:CBASS cGAMP-activated phospholipase [Metabacillus malikii]MDQ0230939.1 patatin-like phospholipase/acyl hydrolase [Metabacillus malikii]